MRIEVKVSRFYDWEPLPKDIKPTEADIKSKRVRVMADGSWHVRVKKTLDTHTQVLLPEEQLIALIIGDAVRDRMAHTRAEALGHKLARVVMPHHAEPQWMKGFDVHDDGPDLALFEKKVDEQIAAGNISDEAKEGLVAAYMTPLSSSDHVDHLHARFKVAKPAAEVTQ